MKSTMQEEKLMRISSLAKKAGVSVQTIHYYLREGLLPSPKKTAPNQALYGPEHLEYIKFIKILQSKRIPLNVIKHAVKSCGHKSDVKQLQGMITLSQQVFKPINSSKHKSLSLEDLSKLSGLSLENLKSIEELGILPESTETSPTIPKNKVSRKYDSVALQIAEHIKQLLDLGFELNDLDIYQRHLEVIQAEINLFHEVFHRINLQPIDRLKVKELSDNIKNCMFAHVLRKLIARHAAEEK